MKFNLEKLKDILYDFSDYIIMVGIVLSIVLIIGWRLDVLFPDTPAMVNADTLSKSEQNISEEIKETKDENTDLADKEKKQTPEIIKVSIPKGSPSTSIGNILVDYGLVESSKDFEKKVNELDLEKKLRSGEFDIAQNESLEKIVKIIANEK